MSIARSALLIALKDLRVQARAPHALATVIVLGVLIIAALALALGPARRTDSAGTAAILWVAYLFGGLLCFESTMDLERRDDALSGLLVAPVDHGTLFVAKLLTNLTLLLVLATTVTPVGILFFGFDLSPAPWAFAAIMTAGLVGVAAMGTLFSSVAGGARTGAGFLAMLVLPLSLPIVVISTQMMERAFSGSPIAGGLGALVAFDVVMLVSSWMVFELMLEP